MRAITMEIEEHGCLCFDPHTVLLEGGGMKQVDYVQLAFKLQSAPPMVEHLVRHAELPMTLKQFGSGQVVIGGGWPASFRGDAPIVGVHCDSVVGSAALAARLVPALAQTSIIRSWAGATTTMDGQSVLGAASTAPGVYFAIGGFAGYTLGPFITRLITDPMLGRRSSEDISPFSPGRF